MPISEQRSRREPLPPPTLARLGAEALGTFLITAAATGIDIWYYTQGDVDYVSRWLARGLATAVAIYTFSEISGAHVDPAVTIGFFARRILSARLATGYIVAQFVGAFAAAALLLAIGGPKVLALGASHPSPHVSLIAAVVTETIATFVLMLVILTTAQEEAIVGRHAALAVGFTVAVCGFVAGPLSGASMNPARTIAPQLLAGELSLIWIYVVGPIAGSLLAVGVQALLCGSPSKSQRRAARGETTARR